MKYEHKKFINRIIKQMNNEFVAQAISNILANAYFPITETSGSKEFYSSLMTSSVTISQLRKIVRTQEFFLWSDLYFQKHINKLIELFTIEGNLINLYKDLDCKYNWVEECLKVEEVRVEQEWNVKYNNPEADSMVKYILSAKSSFRDVDWFSSFLSYLNTKEEKIILFKNRKMKNFCVERVGELFLYQFKPAKYFKT